MGMMPGGYPPQPGMMYPPPGPSMFPPMPPPPPFGAPLPPQSGFGAPPPVGVGYPSLYPEMNPMLGIHPCAPPAEITTTVVTVEHGIGAPVMEAAVQHEKQEVKEKQREKEHEVEKKVCGVFLYLCPSIQLNSDNPELFGTVEIHLDDSWRL